MRKSAARDARVTLRVMQQNAILNGLEESFAAKVERQGTLVNLALRQKIYDAEQPIREVYFPLECVLSIVTRMKDGNQIEVGTIGREGMSAFPLLLGASSTANDCYCQVHGSAVTISAELFHELRTTSRGFRQLLDRYLQAYVNMLGQLAACNRLHSVYERCARWLLMTHDRVDSDEIALTHEFLAMMLGTGRSGVTIAAGTLQQAGFIHYAHGTIAIRDRDGLENASCECYDIARRQFGGLLRSVSGPADKPETRA
ncbi:MAG: Crp/Fnr family transcriptional regulator [Vulcanimicrobiaceae bacterium]